MNITAELTKLDEVLKFMQTNVTGEVSEQWNTVQLTLALLEKEAKRLLLPWGYVRQKSTSLRYHLAVLFGVEDDGGHTQQMHVVWALGDIQALRSEHCFGPALDREARGARHGDDWKTVQ